MPPETPPQTSAPLYPYAEPDKPQRPWGLIIILSLSIIGVLAIMWFFIIKPIGIISDKAGDLFNQTQNQGNNQGIAVGEPNPGACNEDLYNCDDFENQADAQAFYDTCVLAGSGDIHQLDGDGNGKACESLE